MEPRIHTGSLPAQYSVIQRMIVCDVGSQTFRACVLDPAARVVYIYSLVSWQSLSTPRRPPVKLARFWHHVDYFQGIHLRKLHECVMCYGLFVAKRMYCRLRLAGAATLAVSAAARYR